MFVYMAPFSILPAVNLKMHGDLRLPGSSPWTSIDRRLPWLPGANQMVVHCFELLELLDEQSMQEPMGHSPILGGTRNLVLSNCNAAMLLYS